MTANTYDEVVPPGRPPGPPSTTKTVRIQNDLLAEAEKFLDENERTLTWLVNKALAAYLEAQR